jgi:NAD(P)-dependent dehydrogenase (short-subunit alcohol dehydrogenase family)
MAERFAELGASVVICGRRAEVLQETAARIGAAHGAAVEAVPCDIRNPEAVAGMLDEIWRTGPLDVLVNNAGALFIAQSERLSHRAVDAVLAPSLHGAIYCTLEVGRRWIDEGRRGGVVLSILPTTIAKSGLLAMTRSLAVEWASRGIRVLAIAPGSFRTEGFMARGRQGRAELGASDTDNSLERAGEPPELANLASFLVSDAASYINGEMVSIDGGRSLRNSGVEDLLARSDAEWAELRASRSR